MKRIPCARHTDVGGAHSHLEVTAVTTLLPWRLRYLKASVIHLSSHKCEVEGLAAQPLPATTHHGGHLPTPKGTGLANSYTHMPWCPSHITDTLNIPQVHKSTQTHENTITFTHPIVIKCVSRVCPHGHMPVQPRGYMMYVRRCKTHVTFSSIPSYTFLQQAHSHFTSGPAHLGSSSTAIFI